MNRLSRKRGTRVRLVVPALALVLAATLAACGDDDDAGDNGDSASEPVVPLPIDEVRTFEVPSVNHVDQTVDYPQTPPVGGDHAPLWQDCGFYDQPIYSEAAVHSMEHSAVWIVYRPDLAADQTAEIQLLAQQPYTLASPWEGDPGAPIVLSAWGAQLAIDSLPSPLADDFLTTYREASTAPEPSFPCTGGTTVTK